MSKRPESWECRDCGSSWAECQAKVCLHCRSKNIFIYWNPKTQKFSTGKPKRIKLKSKPKKMQLKVED